MSHTSYLRAVFRCLFKYMGPCIWTLPTAIGMLIWSTLTPWLLFPSPRPSSPSPPSLLLFLPPSLLFLLSILPHPHSSLLTLSSLFSPTSSSHSPCPPFPLLSPPPPPFFRHLARIEYILNDVTNAFNNQHKATLILERVLGVDHPETITAYINLALHSNASNQPATALRLLYRSVMWLLCCRSDVSGDVTMMSFSFRARYLILLVFGEDHPEMATCDSNIAIILHSVKDYKNSLSFLLNALVIHKKWVVWSLFLLSCDVPRLQPQVPW